MDFLSFFRRGTWQRPIVWTINIYRDHFIFIEFFRWKKKKFQSKNLIHPPIDDYLLLKILRGTWQRPRKMFKNFILQGEYGKGYYGNYLKFPNFQIQNSANLLSKFFNFYFCVIGLRQQSIQCWLFVFKFICVSYHLSKCKIANIFWNLKCKTSMKIEVWN